jgi:hypothetical protein
MINIQQIDRYFQIISLYNFDKKTESSSQTIFVQWPVADGWTVLITAVLYLSEYWLTDFYRVGLW